MSTVERRLQGIICDFWKLPKREGGLLLHLIMQSKSSRAVFARETLQSLHPTSLFNRTGIKNNPAHTFATHLSPAFWILLLADMQAMGLLTDAQTHRIEDCLLETVDMRGEWKAV